jgi:hypothetical protein
MRCPFEWDDVAEVRSADCAVYGLTLPINADLTLLLGLVGLQGTRT